MSSAELQKKFKKKSLGKEESYLDLLLPRYLDAELT